MSAYRLFRTMGLRHIFMGLPRVLQLLSAHVFC